MRSSSSIMFSAGGLVGWMMYNIAAPDVLVDLDEELSVRELAESLPARAAVPNVPQPPRQERPVGRAT